MKLLVHRVMKQLTLRPLIRKWWYLREARPASSQIVKRLQYLCVQHRFTNQTLVVVVQYVTTIEARNHACSSQIGQVILNKSCHRHLVSNMVKRYREEVAS